KSTVNYNENGAWFAAQLCLGAQALGAWGASQVIQQRIERHQFAPDEVPNLTAYWPSDNIAVVYTGITGLLNLLVIIDALSRADVRIPQISSRPPPSPAR